MDKEIPDNSGSSNNDNVNLALPQPELKKPPILDEVKPIEDLKKAEDNNNNNVKIQVVKVSDAPGNPVKGVEVQQIEVKPPILAETKPLLEELKKEVPADAKIIKVEDASGKDTFIVAKELPLPKSAETPPSTAAAASTKDQPKVLIVKASSSSKPTKKTSKEEVSCKTAIPYRDELTFMNLLEICGLVLVTVLHSFGILIVAFFFSIYQVLVSIFYFLKYLKEHPRQTKFGIQALTSKCTSLVRYTYDRVWTFSGIFRFLTEPPPPPIFQQRTLSGDFRMDEEELKRFEAMKKQKMFHQRRMNGEIIFIGYQPYKPPKNLELSDNNKKSM